MKIAISGASGELGRLAAQSLLELMPAKDVVLVSRTPEKLADFVARGAELREGDFDRPETLAQAFAGVERLLLVSTGVVGEQRRTQHRAAIEAAKKAGIRRIAYTSSVGMLPGNPSFIIPDHAYTERLLRECAMETIVLRMAGYADILANAVAPQAIKTGQWISRSGDGCIAVVAKEDCARAAACAVAGEGFAGGIYEITGPEMLTHRQAAALASEMSGKPIAYVEPDDSEAGKDQANTWIGPFTMADLISSETAIKLGYSAICSHHVKMLTGKPAKSLRELYSAAGIGH